MKGCRGCLFGVLCVLSVLAFAFAVLFARRQTRIREREKERAETEALIRAHTDNAPPPDFHGWLAEFGANEPDPSTPEGQASLEAEGARLPLAKERLQRLLERFHSMLTSENGAVEDAYLSDFLQTLEGFSRASCAELLWSVRWGKCGGKILRNKVVMAGPERGAVVVERYYRVICRMVDLLWTRGGLNTRLPRRTSGLIPRLGTASIWRDVRTGAGLRPLSINALNTGRSSAATVKTRIFAGHIDIGRNGIISITRSE